jgi:hypothetical protein
VVAVVDSVVMGALEMIQAVLPRVGVEVEVATPAMAVAQGKIAQAAAAVFRVMAVTAA